MSDSYWEMADYVFRDAKCSSQLLAIQRFKGTLTLGPEIPGEPYRNIDLVAKSKSLDLRDAAAVKDYNTYAAFGYTDWAVGVPKELVGRKDSKGNTVKESSFFGVVKVSENELVMSDLQRTEKERETTLNDEIFKRHVK